MAELRAWNKFENEKTPYSSWTELFNKEIDSKEIWGSVIRLKHSVLLYGPKYESVEQFAETCLSPNSEKKHIFERIFEKKKTKSSALLKLKLYFEMKLKQMERHDHFRLHLNIYYQYILWNSDTYNYTFNQKVIL